MNNNRFNTLSEASQDLAKRGYTGNFQVNGKGKLTDNKDLELDASEVILDEFHRFEGMSNPADSTILYAVKTKSGLKGTVVDSYGADGSEITSDFMNTVEQHQFD